MTARAHDHTGSQIGTLSAITLTLNDLAPAIGGFVATAFGLHWVYVVVIVAILVAIAPLILGREEVQHYPFRLSKIPWNSYRDFFANGLYNVPGFVETIIWPMAISLFIVSYSGIGALSSVLVLSSIAISLYVGNREDKLGERRFINQGVVTGIIKLVASSPIGVFGVNFVSGTSNALLANSFTSRYYKNADTDRMMEYTWG